MTDTLGVTPSGIFGEGVFASLTIGETNGICPSGFFLGELNVTGLGGRDVQFTWVPSGFTFERGILNINSGDGMVIDDCSVVSFNPSSVILQCADNGSGSYAFCFETSRTSPPTSVEVTAAALTDEETGACEQTTEEFYVQTVAEKEGIISVFDCSVTPGECAVQCADLGFQAYVDVSGVTSQSTSESIVTLVPLQAGVQFTGTSAQPGCITFFPIGLPPQFNVGLRCTENDVPSTTASFCFGLAGSFDQAEFLVTAESTEPENGFCTVETGSVVRSLP
mmetsp:Transcript_33101/g.65692  ORF Transcript_33101/g.65692 Transcript_33101/m.65692 type:complete len:279 (+) Transcript_33101:297-1133(+)